jgi:uncharacterized protein YbjT (DUF2867 family)
MVGQGVLRECLRSSEVEGVLSIVRRASGQQHPKLREIVHQDFADFFEIEGELSGYDACFFCLGVSSLGMNERNYRWVTYEFALAAAQTLVRLNPNMTFIYVSGAGTDSSGRGSTTWARVKGETENALLEMRFKAAYMFRPGLIVPLHGIRSKTAVYQVTYTLLTPLLSMLLRAFPKYVTTTEQVGRAMLHVAKQGYPKAVLEAADIASA